MQACFLLHLRRFLLACLAVSGFPFLELMPAATSMHGWQAEGAQEPTTASAFLGRPPRIIMPSTAGGT